MKQFLKSLAVLCVSAMPIMTLNAQKITDVYELSMRIQTPRVYKNTQSRGYRKYQSQKLKGYLLMTYDTTDNNSGPTLSVVGLENRTYKINGSGITYKTVIDEDTVYPRVNLIGDNSKNQFKTASVAFALICDPSYNIGGIEEDNSLYITLSAKGSVSTKKRRNCQVINILQGYLAGTLGCGCTAYGHKSPTRINGWYGPLPRVDDVAAAHGTWKAKYKYSTYNK